MPEELPDVVTPVSKEEMFQALHDAWLKEIGSEPKKESLAILVAQWALETGWGKFMHCYNLGNAKHTDKDGRDWTYYKCNEIIKGETVWFSPKHPACAFRAFRTLQEGAADYFTLIHKRFSRSWPSVEAGDPSNYSHAIKQQGYYTADETSYTKGVVGCYSMAMKAKWPGEGGAKTPLPEPHPSLGPKDPFGAHEGADFAIAAYERAIGARGWKLDAADEKNWNVEHDEDLGPGNFEKLKPGSGDLALILTADGPRAGRVVTVVAGTSKNYDSGALFVTGMGKSGIGIDKLTIESKPLKFDASYTEWKADEDKPGAGKAWIARLLRLSDATPDKLDKMPEAERTQRWHIKKNEIVLSPGTDIKWEAKKKPNDPAVNTNESGGGGDPAPAAPKKGEGRPADEDRNAFKTPPEVVQLPPPVQVDAHTVKFKVGNYPGRIAFTIKKPGEPLPPCPPPGKPEAPAAEGKRDDFLHAALNLIGVPYQAGSTDPAKGLDGPGMVALCLKRVGMLKTDDKLPDNEGLHAMFGSMGGKADAPPDDIVPGDLAWFGKGDHDNIPQQHCMVYLGGGRVLGPIPDGGPNNGAVQVIPAIAVPEAFAGWTHLADLGRDTGHTAHPGHPPAEGEPLTAALLPASPSARYDVLKAVVAKRGGTWMDDKGKVNLVAVRNMHGRTMILPKEDDWNDSIYASFLDDDGHKCSLELRASVSPGHDAEKVNKWHLLDGSYKFKLEDNAGKKVLRPDGNVKAWQDVHGQGALRPGDLVGDDAPATAAAPPPAAKEEPVPVAKGNDFVEITVKDEAGKALDGWSYELASKKGKLDGSGHAKIDGIAAGSYSLRVFKDAAGEPAKAPPKIDPPPAEMGDPGQGFTSKLRAAPLDETIAAFKDEGENKGKVKDW